MTPSPFADHDHVSAKAQVVKEHRGRGDKNAMSCPPEPVLSEAEGCGHRLFIDEFISFRL